MPTKIKGLTGVDKVEAGAVITNPSFSGNATVTGSMTVGGVNVFSGPYRNLIINGDMRIAQRATSASSYIYQGYATVDRFLFNVGNGLGTWTISQDTDVPSGQGFATSSKLLCTTANASPATNAFLTMVQKIEAQNLQQLAFGTANAKSLTASFWVKSNKTGTYVLMMYRPDSGRLLSKTYTIDAANTWEKKTITVVGDTTGSIPNDNGDGLNLYWHLGDGTDRTSGTANTDWGAYSTPNEAAGQTVNLGDATSNYFNITGVQLEVGEGASDFEFLPYDVQLARCQRYFQRHYDPAMRGVYNGSTSNGATRMGFVPIVSMRSSPSIGATGTFNFWDGTSTVASTSLGSVFTSPSSIEAEWNTTGGLTAGKAAVMYTSNTYSKWIDLSSEL